MISRDVAPAMGSGSPGSTPRRAGRARPSRGARRARTVVRSAACLLAAWAICHTWLVEGLFIPLGIPSGSMAEALLGPHCRFVCSACGQAFLCDADVTPMGRWRECPHCGDVTENTSPAKVAGGDRVWLLRSAYAWRGPRRWEVVAFRDPDRASRLTVKRVVGLPGESVEIRGGDVYVNGQIASKTLADQWEMAVLVHDAAVTGTRGRAVESRWRPAAAESRWRGADGGFTNQDSLSPPAPLPKGEGRRDDAVDWLVYHHRRRAGGSQVAGAVTDELSYNQWRTRREDEIHSVADLLLRFDVGQMVGPGWLIVRAADGEKGLEAWVRPETGACEFRFAGQSVRRGRLPNRPPIEHMEVTFSVVDRQLILAIDGRPVIGRLLLPKDCRWRASACPLAIGSAGGLTMKLSGLRVYRDVYYTRPTGVLGRWGFDRPVKLGPSEYFVLGDNSLVSEDSRCWLTGPGVPGELIEGKPVAVRVPWAAH